MLPASARVRVAHRCDAALVCRCFWGLPLRVAAGKLLYLGFEECSRFRAGIGRGTHDGDCASKAALVPESCFPSALSANLLAEFPLGRTRRGRLGFGCGACTVAHPWSGICPSPRAWYESMTVSGSACGFDDRGAPSSNSVSAGCRLFDWKNPRASDSYGLDQGDFGLRADRTTAQESKHERSQRLDRGRFLGDAQDRGAALAAGGS